MKKNYKVSNKLELTRTLIISIENINPTLYQKLQKNLNEIPELNLLYHNIKFNVNLDNLILDKNHKLLLLLLQKYLHSNNLKIIDQTFTNNIKSKKKNVFNKNKKKPTSYENYDHYNYEQYYERLKYYEKKLKPTLNKYYREEKILFTTLKGLVLTEFL